MIEFTVPGDVVAWARAGKRGPHSGAPHKVAFTPKKQRNFAATVKDLCERAMNGAAPMEGPVELSLVATWLWPKSMSARKRAAPGAKWKVSRPDWDNVGKMVGDALNAVAWRDDAIIVSGHVWKMYGERAGLTVRIRSLATESEHGSEQVDDGARREVASDVSRGDVERAHG